MPEIWSLSLSKVSALIRMCGACFRRRRIRRQGNFAALLLVMGCTFLPSGFTLILFRALVELESVPPVFTRLLFRMIGLSVLWLGFHLSLV